MTIRVVLADDQVLIRAGLRVLIDSGADVRVVGEAANGAEAVDVVRATRPDVAVLDIRMPLVDGLQATRRITADPDLAGVKVLILTTFELDQYVFDALRAGASGFLGKGVDSSQLLDAIRTVSAGDALLSPRATAALISRYLAVPPDDAIPSDAIPSDDSRVRPVSLGVLTDREREIVALAAHGLSNDDIAKKLYLSPLTAKTHVNRAMMKLGARDRAQLVIAAFQSGLVRPGGPAD